MYLCKKKKSFPSCITRPPPTHDVGAHADSDQSWPDLAVKFYLGQPDSTR